MSEDATSQPSDTTTAPTSATEDDTAQQMLAVAATQTPADQADITSSRPEQPEPAKADEDKLGDNGKRALTSERKARRDAEKALNDVRTELAQYRDAEKTELQKAQDAAKRYESELTTTRVANARLMAAVAHDLPPDLIDLLGDGTDEQIDARAKLLAEKLAAVTPAATAEPDKPVKPAATSTRPVESLTPGGRPATQEPEDPNDWLRRLAGRAP